MGLARYTKKYTLQNEEYGGISENNVAIQIFFFALKEPRHFENVFFAKKMLPP